MAARTKKTAAPKKPSAKKPAAKTAPKRTRKTTPKQTAKKPAADNVTTNDAFQKISDRAADVLEKNGKTTADVQFTTDERPEPKPRRQSGGGTRKTFKVFDGKYSVTTLIKWMAVQGFTKKDARKAVDELASPDVADNTLLILGACRKGQRGADQVKLTKEEAAIVNAYRSK